jgi:hypothetical protein
MIKLSALMLPRPTRLQTSPKWSAKVSAQVELDGSVERLQEIPALARNYPDRTASSTCL